MVNLTRIYTKTGDDGSTSLDSVGSIVAGKVAGRAPGELVR